MVRTTSGNSVGLAARFPYIVQSVFPTLAKADVETVRDQAHIGAHDPGHLDIAHAVIHRVRVVHPVFLHQHTFHAEVRGHSGDLTRLVRLNPTDGHQRVATLRD